MKAIRILYQGRVQGVGFRYSVRQLAAGFEVCGYVKNLMDGRVELLLQGEQTEVDGFLTEIENSHLKGFIKDKIEQTIDPDEQMRGFEIRF